MSININWDNLTAGEDGLALAESIRAFIHDRFQQVPLPDMIRSVHVHSFDFGTVAPEIELKDVSDPLPDFYNDSDDGEDSEASGDDDELTLSEDGDHERVAQVAQVISVDKVRVHQSTGTTYSQQEPSATIPLRLHTKLDRRQSTQSQSPFDISPFLTRTPTPGIPGGTSNMSSFHPSLAAGLHGTTSPLAAMAGATLANSWLENHGQLSSLQEHEPLISSPDLPTSGLASPGFPSALSPLSDGKQSYASDAQPDRSVEDVQVVMHLRYAGDVKMTLTADILLDYPMPSFVGIPLQIKLTGLSFDGIAILAYIKRKAHFCFLSPEDAQALVGQESNLNLHKEPLETPQEHPTHTSESTSDPAAQDTQIGSEDNTHNQTNNNSRVGQVGGLFEDIKIESEIGEKTSGRQVLKNVGKVEKFILEQVTQIFENEFVHPNFWTFLV